MSEDVYLVQSNFSKLFVEYVDVENTPESITHATFNHAFSEKLTIVLMEQMIAGSTARSETQVKDVTKTGFRIKDESGTSQVERFTAMAIGRRTTT